MKTSNALDVFCGYLVYDIWIANQDRHDQNWGVIRSEDGGFFLAPSYDHGSCMGRNETDEKRATKMTTKDNGQSINKYSASARTSMFRNPSSEKSMLASEVLSYISEARKEAVNNWKQQLDSISQNSVISIFDKVPTKIMTDISKEFTLKLININRIMILKGEAK